MIMQKAKQIYQKYESLFHNLSYMTILKVFMLILPLISYPYLIRVTGSDNFGIVVYTLSIMAFFRIFVNFGFEMSAVKNVAQNSDDKKELSKIISSILILQIIFYIIGFLILFSLIQIFEQFKTYQELLYYAYLLPLCDILFLVWFFQGIEKMKYITIVNTIAGLIGLALIFIFIQDKDDYIFIPLLQAISLLIGSIYSLYLVFKKEDIQFHIPSKDELVFYLKESFPFFISRSSAVFNDEISVVLLANFVNMSAVSYYDLAKKIITAFKIPNSIINQVLYPYIAKRQDKILAKKVFNIRIAIAIFLMIIVYIFGEYFVLFLGGQDMLATMPILNIFSIMLLFTAVTYYTGSTILVAFGYANKFNISVIYSTLLYLILSAVLYITDNISVYSILFILLAAEFYLLGYRYYYCKRFKIL